MYKITCENNHYIAEVEDIKVGEPIIAERFSNFAKGIKPFNACDPIILRCCPKCDGKVFKVNLNGGGFRIHTDKGWMP